MRKCNIAHNMDKVIKDIIHNIHNSDTQMVISVTGAGSDVINWLLSVPGASKTLLEANIPYSESSQKSFLNKPEILKSVSKDHANNLAKESYRRASQLRESDIPVIGVGCTAAISTNRNRKGENQAFITIWGDKTLNTIQLLLDKSKSDRAKDEKKISLLILNQIAKSITEISKIKIPLDQNDRLIEILDIKFESTINSLIHNQISSFISRASSQNLIADGKFSGIILPGSFNPLHKGHIKLKEYITQNYDQEFAYEISIKNVDKPDLNEEEILERLNQFDSTENIIVDKAPLFSEKSTLFPKSTFLIGYDTAERLINAKYYDGNYRKMTKSLELIEDNKCAFLVAGRIQNGLFSTLEDLNIPEDFKSLFVEIPESDFRVDESSSEIRNRGKNGF